MRVGIIALLHESNTFVSGSTTLEHFRDDLLLTGNSVCDQMADAHHEVGGFIEGLQRQGFEAVGVFAARAVPFGAVSQEAYDQLIDNMFRELEKVGRLDGLLVALHGATVSEQIHDADGHCLTALRKKVGRSTPIVGTLDAHANLSEAMVRGTNALIAYRTNPHLDQRARGREAATLMVRTLKREIVPVQAAVMPPVAINIACQRTDGDPCRAWFALADSQLQQPGVLSNSLLLGFPYADVHEMGSAAIVVTDNDSPLANRLAGELGDYLWAQRHEFDPQLLGIDEALDRASQLDGPVCLLDMGDNVGGGSPGDGTLLGQAIHRRKLGEAFVCIWDPAAVRVAESSGVGARVSLRMGGRTDALHGTPLEADCTVMSLHDGRFEEPEPRHGGFAEMDQGRTAIVRTESGLTIMLTSRRTPPFSLRQLTSCGLDPSSFELIVAKGVNAPVAAYAPVCKHFVRVNTPGVTTADMRSLNYQHRRRPMFPFEPQGSHHAPRDEA